jgi:hypothetical protein
MDSGLSFGPMSQDATVLERSRSVSRVGRILEILIAAKTIVAALALYWMVRELIALVHVRGTGNTEAPEIRAVIAAGRFVFVVNTPLLFATIFVWLVWQFFVHDLVARAAGPPLGFGRWASVGWWFVPFANLLMPYRVMQELWNKTDGLTSGSEDRRLLRWWVPWDAQVVLLYVMLFLGSSEPSIDRSIVLHVVAIASELLFIVCTLPAITVVQALTKGVTTAMPVPAAEVSAPPIPIPVRVDLDGQSFL